MKTHQPFVTANWMKKTLAITLTYFVLGYTLQADTAPVPTSPSTGTWTATDPGPGGVVIAGGAIVPGTGITINLPTISSPVVVPGGPITPSAPLIITQPTPLDQLETKEDTPNGPKWSISDQAPQGLTVALSPAGVVKAPIVSMVLDAKTGRYDDAVGAEMGCTVTQLYSNNTLTGQQIFCPLVSKLKPVTFTFGNTSGSTCLGAPLSTWEGLDVVAAANSLCLLRPGASYSHYYFQCGMQSDANGQKYCDAATVAFPIMLETTKHNKSKDLFNDPLTFQVQNAERTISASFTTTYGHAIVVTNPDQLGWVKIQKVHVQSSDSDEKTCLASSGVSMMILFNDCHESKGVEIAEIVLVNVATLVVGAFVGPALGGVASAIRGSTALRVLVEASDTPSEVWAPFMD